MGEVEKTHANREHGSRTDFGEGYKFGARLAGLINEVDGLLDATFKVKPTRLGCNLG